MSKVSTLRKKKISFLKDNVISDTDTKSARNKRKREEKNARRETRNEILLATDNNSVTSESSACPPCITPNKKVNKQSVTTANKTVINTKELMCDLGNNEAVDSATVNINRLIIKSNPKTNMSADKHQANVPTRNSFQVLQNEDEPNEDQPQMDTDEEQQNKQTKKPPPPIIIHGKVNNHSQLTKSIKQHTTGHFNIKYTRDNTNITINNRKEREQYMAQLIKQNVEFHTYSDTSDKTHAFVIRGLTNDVTEAEVEDELKAIHQIPVTKCYKMTLKHLLNTNSTKALFLLVTNNTVTLKALSAKVKHLIYTKIYFERRRNNRKITQCHTCQEWGHATSNCHAKYKCMFCAQNHYTKDCEDKNNLKCANCGGKHQANDTECTAYKQKLAFITNNDNQRQQPAPKYQYNDNNYPATLKPAPPPRQNAWTQRESQRQQQNQDTQPQQHDQQQQQSQTQQPTHQEQHHQQQHRQQQPRQPPPTYTGNPPINYTTQQATFQELTAELTKLNNLVNITEMIRAIKDINTILETCNTKQEKVLAFSQFSAHLDNYDI